MKKPLLLLPFICLSVALNAQSIIKTDTTKKNSDVFTAVEIEPTYRGGMQGFYRYLAGALRYPEVDVKNKIQGRVFIQFIVEKDGVLSDFKVIRAPSETLGAEAVRVISQSPRWIPGIQNGKPVRVRFTLPVKFEIPVDTTHTKFDPIAKLDTATNKQVFKHVQIDPSPKNGFDAFYAFIDKEFRFSKVNRKDIHGRIMVSFIVEKDGSLTEVKIERRLAPELDEEVIRIIGILPKWKPGMVDGNPVRVRFTIPLSFE